MNTIIENTDVIRLTDAPITPGLTFRRFRGEADYETIARLMNSSFQADGFNILINVEEVANNYRHAQRTDPYQDSIFAEIDGQVVGFGRCRWSTELNGEYRYYFEIFLEPAGRIDGIAMTMANFLIDRLNVISQEHPADAVKYLQTRWLDGNAWFEDVVVGLGFEKVRFGIDMIRPCSEPVEIAPLPEGIEVRPVGPEDYRKVYDAEVEAFRDHWGYVPPTEEDFHRWINSRYFKPELWKVAWKDDQVVGMVLNLIIQEENDYFNRKRGYTEDISVRRPWRRQGVARALLTRSVKMFQEMGMEETCLGVDTENPNGAMSLYTSVGYREIARFTTYRAPLVQNRQVW